MEHKKVFSHAGLSLFMMVIVVNAVQVLAMGGTALFAPALLEKPWFGLALIFVSLHVVGLAVFYLMMRKPAVSLPKKEKMRMSVTDFIVIFLICMAATYLFNMVSTLINYLIGLIKHAPVVNPLEAVLGGNLVFQILVTSVSAPIVEEIIFRKLLLDHLRPYGDKTAIWVTALAFALFHGNLSQALYALVLGMIFAYIVIRTNDIRYPIALHVLVNLFGTALMPLMVAGGELFTMLAGLLVIAFLISGIILFILNIKRIVIEEGEIALDKSVRFKTIYLNAGMILYIISCVAMFVITIITPAV